MNALKVFRHNSDILNGSKPDLDDLDNISENSVDDRYHQASRILGGATIDVNQYSQDTNKLEF